METKNFQQQLVDNFKTVHQRLSDTASNIPWSDLWTDGREAALKVYSYGTSAYTSTSTWVRGVDWAKHWSTAENIASLIADLSVIAYAAIKPISIRAYQSTKAWVKKVDWLDVLEIMVIGFIHFVQGVYEAGVRTGRWMHSANDVLAREFVYLTGALERPAPTAPVTPDPEPQGNAEAQSPNEAVRHRTFAEVKADLLADPQVAQAYEDLKAELNEVNTGSVTEEFQPSEEDQASNPFVQDAVDWMMNEVTEEMAEHYSNRLDKVMNKLNDNNFTKTEDSTCSPASHPLYAQLESMTVKELRQASGIYNKQVKKADLIHAAGMKLAD